MVLREYLILRRPRSGRLEGRTMVIPLDFQLFHKLRGGAQRRLEEHTMFAQPLHANSFTSPQLDRCNELLSLRILPSRCSSLPYCSSRLRPALTDGSSLVKRPSRFAASQACN